MARLLVQYHALNGLRWRRVGEQCRTWCLYGPLVCTVSCSQWFEMAMGRGAVQNMVSIWPSLVCTVSCSQWFEVAMGRGAVQNMVSIWHSC